MKYFLFILLFPSLLQAQSIAVSKDTSVWITSGDSRITVKYAGQSKDDDTLRVGFGISIYPDTVFGKSIIKYDTIGGWHLVSDTSKGWNPASAMYLFEVRVYRGKWIDKSGGPNKEGAQSTMAIGNWDVIPEHFKWLDSNKKPFNLKVWQ